MTPTVTATAPKTSATATNHIARRLREPSSSGGASAGSGSDGDESPVTVDWSPRPLDGVRCDVAGGDDSILELDAESRNGFAAPFRDDGGAAAVAAATGSFFDFTASACF